jgi:glycosyltransferase involved in cell wall biosynthesis
MSEQPEVTWLMSVRNAMPYLPETLASITSQSYSNHKLFVWVDPSADRTLEELHRWVPGRIPGQIFEDRSLSLGSSLRFLVERADTEFCARIDGDDVNLPQRLERQVEFMLTHPHVGIVGSRIRVIDENSNPKEDWTYELEDTELRWMARWRARFCHPSVLFRRSAVIAAGNYGDVPVEDCDLWIRLAAVAEMANLPDVLLLYRRTKTSQTGTTTDFTPLNRQVAQHNISRLFPNLSDPAQAMALWEVTHPSQFDKKIPASFLQLRQLEEAAILFAHQAGKPDAYFKNSQSYQEQRYHLRRRALERLGFGPLIRLRKRLTTNA